MGREEKKKRENTVAHLLRVLLFSLLLPFFLSFEDLRVDFAMSRRIASPLPLPVSVLTRRTVGIEGFI